VYCRRIQSKQDLYKSLAEIRRWEALCENLGVKSAILKNLRYEWMEVEEKKRRCLQTVYEQGDVGWESVVRVVMDHPFNNRGLAKRIAEKYCVKNDLGSADGKLINVTVMVSNFQMCNDVAGSQ